MYKYRAVFVEMEIVKVNRKSCAESTGVRFTTPLPTGHDTFIAANSAKNRDDLKT